MRYIQYFHLVKYLNECAFIKIMDIKEVLSSKYFERILLSVFILVILFAYSYRFGAWFYDIVPWIFFVGMIASLGTIVGVLMFPLAIIYQTLFYYKLTFLPLAFTTVYSIIILLILISVRFMKKETIKRDVNLVLIIVLGITALLSTIMNGYHIGIGNPEFTHYIEGILIFFVIGTFVSTKKKLRLFNWMLLFAIAALAFRLYNHVFSYDIAIPGFENNYLARVLSFYVPFLIGLFWAERKKYLKFLVLIVLVFTAQGITQLGSRATYLALGIAVPLMLIKNFKKKSTWGFMGLGLVFLMFFASPFLFQDVKSISYALQGTESEEDSIQGRALVAEMGWETFRKSPLVGYGVYPSIFENLMLKNYGWYKSGHNAFIIIAVEMGIFGLLAYVGLFISSIYYCYKAQMLSKGKDDYIYHISQGTMFGLIAIGINQAMLNNPWIPTVFIGFGLSTALYYLAKTGHKGKFKIPKWMLPLILFMTLASVLMFIFYIFVKLVLG